MALKQHQRLGETVWSRMPRVNSEIFTLTYGALVMQVSCLSVLCCVLCFSFSYVIVCALNFVPPVLFCAAVAKRLRRSGSCKRPAGENVSSSYRGMYFFYLLLTD
jgi:hypothetical protein